MELCARARTHTKHISQDNFTNGMLVQFRCPRLYSHQCPYKVKVVHSGVSQSSRIWTSGLHMHGNEREHHNVTFPADVRQQIHDYIKQGYRAKKICSELMGNPAVQHLRLPSLVQIQNYVARTKKKVNGIDSIFTTADLLQYAREHNLLQMAALDNNLPDHQPGVIFMLRGHLLDERNELVPIAQCTDAGIVSLPPAPPQLLHLHATLAEVISAQAARLTVVNAVGRVAIAVTEALNATSALKGSQALHFGFRDMLARLHWNTLFGRFTEGVNLKSMAQQVNGFLLTGVVCL